MRPDLESSVNFRDSAKREYKDLLFTSYSMEIRARDDLIFMLSKKEPVPCKKLWLIIRSVALVPITSIISKGL